MTKRTRRTLLVVAAVLALLALAVFLRSKAPPEAARLLPEADGVLYVNLRPVRAFFKKNLNPPSRDPDYQAFVDATGIDWEKDLDEAAIALHRMPDPNGPNGPVAYSMVLEGKLTGPKLRTWLETHAAVRETYGGKTIYAIPSEGRTVRVCQIGYDMVAASNFPTPEMIHSMIDRHRTAALPFSGSSLLERYYREVPLLALAWGVGEIGTPFNESGSISVLGWQLPLQSDSTYIASISPGLPLAGALRLRVEEIAPTEQAAAQQAAVLDTLISLARGFAEPLNQNQAANRGLRDLLKSAQVTQKRDRVLLTAAVPTTVFSQVASAQNSSGGTTSPAAPASQ
ncbi:MAG TPA: hypothetical protein VG267_21650 [Terracidiphilus sp.]|jgi:hypothetical protein|nr:hypothetical protein [Terracidiphilus sp.]